MINEKDQNSLSSSILKTSMKIRDHRFSHLGLDRSLPFFYPWIPLEELISIELFQEIFAFIISEKLTFQRIPVFGSINDSQNDFSHDPSRLTKSVVTFYGSVRFHRVFYHFIAPEETY